MLKRITKLAAKKLFAESKPVMFCPNKMRPDGPFSMGCWIHPKEWLEKAKMYRGNPKLWKGDVVATAWDLAYNNWAYYNVDNGEMGRYAHYYIEA